MRVVIESIHHGHQRYPTVGDWTIDQQTGDIHVYVSQTGNERYNYLVAMHELAEAIWCQMNGIPQRDVDKWDMHHEAMHDADPSRPYHEPGDNIMAPYHPGHMFGKAVEALMAVALHIDPVHYEVTLDALDARFGRPKNWTDLSGHAPYHQPGLGAGYGGLGAGGDPYKEQSVRLDRGRTTIQDDEDFRRQAEQQKANPSPSPRVPRLEDEFPTHAAVQNQEKNTPQIQKNDQGRGEAPKRDGW